MSIKIKRWVICKPGRSPATKHYHDRNVAVMCVSPYSVAQYLDMTHAWRPLDIHPDWRTWEGATTKGNK